MLTADCQTRVFSGITARLWPSAVKKRDLAGIDCYWGTVELINDSRVSLSSGNLKLTACFVLHGFGRFLGFSDWFATGISEHLKEGSFTLMKNALFCMLWNMEMTWFVLLHIISRVEPHIPAPSLPGISSAWQVCQRKDKLAVEICSGQTRRDILLLTGYSLISPRYGTWAWLWNKCLWSILFIGLRNVMTFIHRCTWTAPF